MRYSVQKDGGGFAIGQINTLFPNVSFAGGVPSAAWLAENEVYEVVDFLQADAVTVQVSVEPFLKDGIVYTVAIQPIPVADAQERQKAQIDDDYRTAIQEDVAFTTVAGVTASFQADSDSQTLIMQASQGYAFVGITPPGFSWKAADNSMVPFTLDDLKGLYLANLSRGWAYFQKRDMLKASIDAAQDIAAIKQLNW